MDFSISQEQKNFRKEIIDFSHTELNENVTERDREQLFRHDLWLKCGSKKLQGLTIPEEYGGKGLDSLSSALAIEALGYGCHDAGLAFTIGAHLFGCATPIWKTGTEEQKKRYLPDLCKGEKIGALAITEPEAGSDAFSMKTFARQDGEGYRLSGEKTFITNGPLADVVIVFAVTDHDKGWKGGISCFLVDKGTPGFSAGDAFEMMGLRTARVGTLKFDDVFVPAESVIGRIGGAGAVFREALTWERIGINACNVGIMERVLDTTIKRARTRKQYGQPIGQFQALAHRIADLKIQLEAAKLVTYRSALEVGHSRHAMLDAAIAKVIVSESFVNAARECVQMFGGYGYLTEYEVERTLRDALSSTIYSGTSEIQRNIIAGWVGLPQ